MHASRVLLLVGLVGRGVVGLLPGPPQKRGRLGVRSSTLSSEEEKTMKVYQRPQQHPLVLLENLLPPPVGIPDEIYNAAVLYNAVYLAFMIFDPSSINDLGSAGTLVFGVFGVIKLIDDQRKYNKERPENKVGRDLNAPYAPPEAGPWAGPISTKTVITDFVEKNLNGQTLVLVDESGKVKPELLDNMLRGRVRVLSPAMEQLRLSADISSYFELDKVKGLDAIARLIDEVVKPRPPYFPVPPKLVPVIAIIDVPSDATKDDVTKILRDVATLKSKAGENIIPVVCLERPDYGLDRLRLNLASFQIENIKI
jgi:hypothetical protein